MKSWPPHRRRYLLLLILAIVLTAVSAVYFGRHLFKPTVGLLINYPEVVSRGGRVLFSPKIPGSPATAAGLLAERDQILAVDGRVIHGIRDVVEAEAGIKGFRPIAVEVLRDGSEHLQLGITPVLPLTRPDWVFALLLCSALGFMAFYLIRQAPQDAASNWIALAAVFYLVFTAVKPFYYESLPANLLVHLGKLTSWLMVFFALYFPRPLGNRNGRLAVILGVTVLYLVFVGARVSLFIRWEAGQGDRWYQWYRVLGRWQNVADGLAFLAYASLLVFSYLRIADREQRRQIEWILAGFLLGVPPYFFLDQLPLILGEAPGLRVSLGGFASLFLAFVPLFFLIGLLRHRVFNLRYFLLRYLLYVMLALVIFAFFFLLYAPVERFFTQTYALPPRAAGFLVTALLFFILVPIRALVCTLLERIFFPEHFTQGVRYSAVLEARNQELRILLDELNLRRRKSFQVGRLQDLKSVLSGIERRVSREADGAAGSLAELERALQRPVPDLPAARGLAALAGNARLGLLELRDFARKLGGLAGLRSGLPAVVEADYLCRSAVVELRKLHPQTGVRLEDGASARIRCHPEELILALRLVLDNAAEAETAPVDQIAVRIGGSRRAVYFQVEDNGPGFSNRREAFRPFFTTKPGHDGLGLFFCRALVERNGGSVEILAVPDGGACVQLTFACEEKLR